MGDMFVEFIDGGEKRKISLSEISSDTKEGKEKLDEIYKEITENNEERDMNFEKFMSNGGPSMTFEKYIGNNRNKDGTHHVNKAKIEENDENNYPNDGKNDSKPVEKLVAELERDEIDMNKKIAKKYTLNECKEYLNLIGFNINNDGGLMYNENFVPLDLEFNIVYIRHGKTEGNTEPRIYQGCVDYKENTLNTTGVNQAYEAADKTIKWIDDNYCIGKNKENLGDKYSEKYEEKSQKNQENCEKNEVKSEKNENSKGKTSVPILIISSPLSRAIQTFIPFYKKYKGIKMFKIIEDMHEMCFGEVDNDQVRNVCQNNIMHLFYLKQNVLVKTIQGHKLIESNENTFYSSYHNYKQNNNNYNSEINTDNNNIVNSESFIETLLRTRNMLLNINDSLYMEKFKSLYNRWLNENNEKNDEKNETNENNEDNENHIYKKPLVLLYGHSMSGAALGILLGHGKTRHSSICFDGPYIMPNATPNFLLPKKP